MTTERENCCELMTEETCDTIEKTKKCKRDLTLGSVSQTHAELILEKLLKGKGVVIKSNDRDPFKNSKRGYSIDLAIYHGDVKIALASDGSIHNNSCVRARDLAKGNILRGKGFVDIHLKAKDVKLLNDNSIELFVDFTKDNLLTTKSLMEIAKKVYDALGFEYDFTDKDFMITSKEVKSKAMTLSNVQEIKHESLIEYIDTLNFEDTIPRHLIFNGVDVGDYLHSLLKKERNDELSGYSKLSLSFARHLIKMKSLNWDLNLHQRSWLKLAKHLSNNGFDLNLLVTDSPDCNYRLCLAWLREIRLNDRRIKDETRSELLALGVELNDQLVGVRQRVINIKSSFKNEGCDKRSEYVKEINEIQSKAIKNSYPKELLKIIDECRKELDTLNSTKIEFKIH